MEHRIHLTPRWKSRCFPSGNLYAARRENRGLVHSKYRSKYTSALFFVPSRVLCNPTSFPQNWNRTEIERWSRARNRDQSDANRRGIWKAKNKRIVHEAIESPLSSVSESSWREDIWKSMSTFVDANFIENSNSLPTRSPLNLVYCSCLIAKENRLQSFSRQCCLRLETHQPADRGVKHQGDQQAHVTADRLDLPHSFFLYESFGILTIRRGADLNRRIALVTVHRVFHERRKRADHSEGTDRHALLRDLSPEQRTVLHLKLHATHRIATETGVIITHAQIALVKIVFIIFIRIGTLFRNTEIIYIFSQIF